MDSALTEKANLFTGGSSWSNLLNIRNHKKLKWGKASQHNSWFTVSLQNKFLMVCKDIFYVFFIQCFLYRLMLSHKSSINCAIIGFYVCVLFWSFCLLTMVYNLEWWEHASVSPKANNFHREGQLNAAFHAFSNDSVYISFSALWAHAVLSFFTCQTVLWVNNALMAC